jgi:hypothetical protein
MPKTDTMRKWQMHIRSIPKIESLKSESKGELFNT